MQLSEAIKQHGDGSVCPARTRIPTHTGTVQHNISLIGLLATSHTNHHGKVAAKFTFVTHVHAPVPTKWWTQDQAAPEVPLSIQKPKSSQRTQTQPQLLVRKCCRRGTGGAHQCSISWTRNAGTRHSPKGCSCTWRVNFCWQPRSPASPLRTAHKHYWLQTQIDEA